MGSPRGKGRSAPGIDMRRLVIDSLVRPREAARGLLTRRVAASALAQAAVAVTCLGVVLGYAALEMTGDAVDPVSAAVLERPLAGAAMQLAVMAVLALLTFRVGRLFGGRGGFLDAALVVVWLNAVTLVIQVAQLVALALMPPLGALIALATLFWLLWAYANFVTELHGFESPVMVLGVVILTMIALVFGLSMLAAMLGVGPQGVQ